MLHKTTYMRGFHIQATDGGIGHVDDFLVDERWNVRYLVVDTSNWIGGKSVIIPSTAIQEGQFTGQENPAEIDPRRSQRMSRCGNGRYQAH